MTVFAAVALSALKFAGDGVIYHTRSGRRARTIDDGVFRLATATCVVLLLPAVLGLSA